MLIHPRGESISVLLGPTQAPAHAIIFMAFMLALLGLPGMYAAQAQRAGMLGLAGFVLMMFGMVYQLYLLLYEMVPAVLLARDPVHQAAFAPGGAVAHGAPSFTYPIGWTLLGFTLLGIASLRARVYAPASGWLLIAFLPLLLLWPEVGRVSGLADLLWSTHFAYSTNTSSVVLFTAWALAGWVLWTRAPVNGSEHAWRRPTAQKA